MVASPKIFYFSVDSYSISCAYGASFIARSCRASLLLTYFLAMKHPIYNGTGQRIFKMNNEGWGDNVAPMGHNQGPGWNDTPAEVAVVVNELPKFEVKYPGQPDTEEPEAFRMRRNAEIDTWLKNKETSTQAVELERDSRAKVTATLFPTPKKGTQRYELANGYKVKLVHNLTYTLGDKDKLNDEGFPLPIAKQIEDMEEAICEKYPVEGPIILNQLIKWVPEISGSQFEKLDKSNAVTADIAAIISEHLIIKPGSPQLAFEEPKAAS